MTLCGDCLSCAGNFLFANRTIYNLIISAVSCAGCRNFVFTYSFTGGVTLCRDCLSGAGNFLFANRTIYNLIVSAVSCAGCRNFVFTYSCTGGVTLCRFYCLCSDYRLAYRAVRTRCKTVIGTGRSYRGVGDRCMTLCIDRCYIGLFDTYCTMMRLASL